MTKIQRPRRVVTHPGTSNTSRRKRGFKITMFAKFSLLSFLTLLILWVPAIQDVIGNDGEQQHDKEEVEVDSSGSTTKATKSVAFQPNNLPRNLTMISLSKNLGDLGYSGLTNQRCMLFGIIYQALLLGAVLDVTTIRYRGAWNESSSISHEELYDIEYWNRYAAKHPGSLPYLVRGTDLAISSSTRVAYATIRLELSFVDSSILRNKKLKSLARHVYLALRPSRGVQNIIDGLQPRGEYGAVHLRIEEDLKTARGFWERRISVRQALDRLKESPDISRCVEKQKPSLSPVVLFAAVAIHDVKDPDDAALLLSGERPWPGSRLVFDSTKENAKLKYGTRASIVSALVDFEISRRATLFASGHFELSTFSRAIGDTRLRVDAGDETNAGNSCRSLFFDYFSKRTLRELFKQQPNPQFWPKPVQWKQLPTDAAAAATMISARGIGSMILQEVFIADHFTNTVHEEK